MRILLVTVEEKCPALYALRAEGYHPEIVVVEDEFTYGKAMQQFWRDGQAFINIEHDMAPWDGAIQALISCALDDALCLYGYPRATNGSLGLIRFSELVLQRFPYVCDRWHRVAWNMLESAVLGPLKHVPKHQHRPNVAHLSGWFSNAN